LRMPDHPPTAEIVSVGTELLLGQIADTNAQEIGKLLAELGFRHVHRQTVGDKLEHIVEALQLALNRADVVLTIGGLGPTEDDLTREAIAGAAGERLEVDPSIVAHLRKVLAERNIPWVDSQSRQALRPKSATPIPNPNGTAPGLICPKGKKSIVALPGPRAEFLPMLRGPVRDHLLALSGGETIVSRTLRIVGVGESIVEERVRELIGGTNPTVAPYAHPGEVHLRISARARSKASALKLIAPVESRIRELMADAIYGIDDESLESVLLDLLRVRKQTLAVAESCTGGLLGGRITNVPGSSDVFLGGVISYANSVKVAQLGVPAETLRLHGAVSRECALEMARGTRELVNADWALSVTGVAGPGGGSDEKPVGLVYLGCSGPGFEEIEERRFGGSRESIRIRSVVAALALLRKGLLSVG
jgi:nicotinamide-nucleotide amidase